MKSACPPKTWDERELPRSRMLLVRQRRRLKQRVLFNLCKYGFVVSEVEEGEEDPEADDRGEQGGVNAQFQLGS